MNSDFFWSGRIEASEHIQTDVNVKEKSDIKSHGVRYRVRINGIHDDKTLVTDLPYADTLFPVTAGTGHGGSSQSANLKLGSIVMGWFLGANKTQPIIFGGIPNSIFTEVTPNDIWRSTAGYTSTVPIYNIPEQFKINPTLHQISVDNVVNQANVDAYKDGVELFNVKSTCDSFIPLGQIQLDIRKVVQDIEKQKRALKKNRANFAQLATQGITNSDTYKKIQNIIKEATTWLKDAEKKVIDEIEEKAKDIFFFLFPEEREKAKKPLENALDLIGCLFKKATKNLARMILKAVLSVAERVVNAPFCLATNLITSIVGKATGALTNSISAILGPLDSIINGVLSVADNVLGIVKNILTFISCEEEGYCPDITKWSILDGPSPSASIDISELFRSIETVSSQVGNLSVDGLLNTLDLDFSDVLRDSCNVGPLFCGPPTVELFGGGGSGATGNAIIGQAGQILGVDITFPGSGYTGSPTIKFNDSCGIGRGAVATPILGPIPILPPELFLSATRIDANQYKIQWSTINAVRLESNFGSTELSGFIVDSPANKKTYTIIAYNKNGASTTRSIVIDPSEIIPINPTDPGEGDNPENSLNILPNLTFSSLFIRDNVYKLIWTSTNVVRVSSNFGVGQDVLNGNKEVSPSTTTTYTLTGYDINGVSITKSIILFPRVITPPTQKEEQLDPNAPCPTQVVIPKFEIPEDYPPDEIGVVKIIINEAGTGYLSAPDGRLGGDGRVWAEKNETYVVRVDGSYDIPYAPGSVIELDKCDTVFPPCEPKFVVQEKSVYIAPECERTPPKLIETDVGSFPYPTLQNGKYPVILYLCDAVIQSRGQNYSPNDKLIIEPSNGAEAVPIFNSAGELENIKIISGGEGFTSRPKISIQTSTGFNASITPVLCIDRVGSVDYDIVPYAKDKVLHVIDCPGNIYAG